MNKYLAATEAWKEIREVNKLLYFKNELLIDLIELIILCRNNENIYLLEIELW